MFQKDAKKFLRIFSLFNKGFNKAREWNFKWESKYSFCKMEILADTPIQMGDNTKHYAYFRYFNWCDSSLNLFFKNWLNQHFSVFADKLETIRRRLREIQKQLNNKSTKAEQKKLKANKKLIPAFQYLKCTGSLKVSCQEAYNISKIKKTGRKWFTQILLCTTQQTFTRSFQKYF